MAGIAYLAEKMGYEVTGCDLEKGGHDPKHLTNTDLLIVTPAVYYQSAKHPEFIEGMRRKIVLTWQEFLGKYLHKDKKVICIAGTHGKSTTTAMVGKLLEDAGLDPLVNLGANYKEWNGGARFGHGDYFVTEADEFYDNFLHYHPEAIILNKVEFDHPDYFKSEEQMLGSYQKFIRNLTGEKILITEKDSLRKKFNLKVMGRHNQQNANLVYILGKKLGIKEEIIIKSLESFPGIGRRMELISDKNGVKIYDDYAHHPTAIRTTLDGLREKYPNEKILVIIEPHGYKRTKALLPKYKGVFDSADKVMIGPIFKARDEIDKTIAVEDIAKVSGHPNIHTFNSFGKLIENCKYVTSDAVEINNYGVVIVMGAGESDKWAKEICNLKI